MYFCAGDAEADADTVVGCIVCATIALAAQIDSKIEIIRILLVILKLALR